MADPVRIYHNARCSKSRSACALVAEAGIQAEVVEYLKTPPTREELMDLLSRLRMQPSQLLRRGEEVFKAEYAGRELSEADCLEALLRHPVLMERPIVVRGTRAVVARPPERALELL